MTEFKKPLEETNISPLAAALLGNAANRAVFGDSSNLGLLRNWEIVKKFDNDEMHTNTVDFICNYVRSILNNDEALHYLNYKLQSFTGMIIQKEPPSLWSLAHSSPAYQSTENDFEAKDIVKELIKQTNLSFKNCHYYKYLIDENYDKALKDQLVRQVQNEVRTIIKGLCILWNNFYSMTGKNEQQTNSLFINFINDNIKGKSPKPVPVFSILGLMGKYVDAFNKEEITQVLEVIILDFKNSYNPKCYITCKCAIDTPSTTHDINLYINYDKLLDKKIQNQIHCFFNFTPDKDIQSYASFTKVFYKELNSLLILQSPKNLKKCRYCGKFGDKNKKYCDGCNKIMEIITEHKQSSFDGIKKTFDRCRKKENVKESIVDYLIKCNKNCPSLTKDPIFKKLVKEHYNISI